MLLTLGKIGRITDLSHPVLSPTIENTKNFYGGQYYIDRELTIGTGGTIDKIGPGYLEVFITYIDLYENNPSNNSYYINYKLTNNKGQLFLWRYYVDGLSGSVTLNTSDRPTQLLTQNNIGSLVYTKDEMDFYFLNKEISKLNKPKYWIRTPILESREVNDFGNNMTVYPDQLFKEGSVWEKEDFSIHQNWFDLYSKTFDLTSSIDYNIHPTNLTGTDTIEWKDISTNTNWKALANNKRFLKTWIKPKNHTLMYSTDMCANLISNTLGEVFLPRNHSTETNDEITTITDLKMYKIDHNTYAPHIASIEFSGDDSMYAGPYYRSAFAYRQAYFHLMRVLGTPDEDMSTTPLIYYSDSGYRTLVDSNLDIVNEYLQTITESKLTEEYKMILRRNGDYFSRMLVRNLGMGIMLSSIHNKQNIETIYEHFKSRYHTDFFKYTTILRDNNVAQHGKFYVPLTQYNKTTNTFHFNFYSDFIRLIHEGDMRKAYYRSDSLNILEDGTLEYYTNRMDTNTIHHQDIRLGPEVRTVYDKSDIATNDINNKVITVLNNKPNMVLTYFKPEIVTSSPRYNVTNKELAYEPTTGWDVNFADRMNRRFTLNNGELLAIDRLTVGFRPIQVKINGVWTDLV